MLIYFIILLIYNLNPIYTQKFFIVDIKMTVDTWVINLKVFIIFFRR